MNNKLIYTFVGISIVFGFIIMIIFFSDIRIIKKDLDNKQYVLDTLQNEQSVLKNELIMLRKQIENKHRYLKKYKDSEKIIEELSYLKELVGLNEVKGAGIEILLNDSPLIDRGTLDINSEALIHAADIRDILNLLRASGANAIAINAQRILINTPINCVGNTFLINNSHLLPPIKITAIGDPEIIFNNINYEKNLYDLKRRKYENGLIFDYKKVKNIFITFYNSDLGIPYIK